MLQGLKRGEAADRTDSVWRRNFALNHALCHRSSANDFCTLQVFVHHSHQLYCSLIRVLSYMFPDHTLPFCALEFVARLLFMTAFIFELWPFSYASASQIPVEHALENIFPVLHFPLHHAVSHAPPARSEAPILFESSLMWHSC